MSNVSDLVIAMRIVLVVGGIVVLLVAWNTEDRIWSPWYWLDRARGGMGDIDIHLQHDGGLSRGAHIIMSIVMILMGIFGRKWMENLAAFVISRGLI